MHAYMRLLLLCETCFTLAACLAVPSPQLKPIDVVEKQLSALSSGNVQQAFAFASPENKKQTGPWQRFEVMVRQTPAYAPLVQCSSYEVLSALSVSENCWQARVLVRPAGSSSAPFAIASPIVHYRWILSRQPAGEGEFSGCWMVDGGARRSSGATATHQRTQTHPPNICVILSLVSLPLSSSLLDAVVPDTAQP